MTLNAPASTRTSQPPADQTRSVQLDNGCVVTLRPLRADDGLRERDFIERLSPQSRYLRRLAPMPSVTPEILAHFMQVDYERAMALVATIHLLEGERQIGVARYSVLPGTGSAECAIVVADEWRGTGLARELMSALIRAARDVHHLDTLVGVTLFENRRMLGFARALGFETEWDPQGARQVRLRHAI
jgi:acetyltransferase